LKLVASSLAALAAAFSLVSTANAGTFSFTGTFSADDEVQLFNFTVGSATTVTLKSYSYAGGVQADGNVVSAGGFDPILALFDSTGAFIANNDDGGEPDVGMDPVTGSVYDTFLQVVLNPGVYTVAVTQYDNFAATTLSELFNRVGEPFFTAAYGCSNGQFCDIGGFNRTNFWAFDILGVDDAETPPVPLPAAAWAFLAGLGLIGAARKRAASTA